MNKNNTTATAQKGQTVTKNTSKVPTGKITTLKDATARKKAREEQYMNFRVNCLKRRCKRMKVSEEETKKLIEKLKEQLKTPNNYSVLIMFNKNDINLVKESLKNEGLVCKVMTDSYIMIDADQETLGTLRGIMPPSAKIHPYVKKKPPILPVQKPKEATKKPLNKATRKANAAKAKLTRKVNNMKMHKKVKKHFKTLQDVRSRNKAIVVQMDNKKTTESLKMAKSWTKKAA